MGAYVQGGVLAAQFLSRLVGAAPRGEYQKFGRTLYPMMARQAQSSGLPVDALWFVGEIIRVEPSGEFRVTATVSSLSEALNYWRGRAGSEHFFYVDCGQSPAPDFSNCRFVEMGSGGLGAVLGGLGAVLGGSGPGSVPAGPGSRSGGLGAVGIIAAVGLGLWLLKRIF